MTTAQLQQDQLERLVDGIGLSAVLDLLSMVCYDKAEHLDSNWQDHGAATAWRRAGETVLKASVSKPVGGVR
jgi:hypothetical protein